MGPCSPIVTQHGARSLSRPPAANRFMAPAWRWLRPAGAANCVKHHLRMTPHEAMPLNEKVGGHRCGVLGHLPAQACRGGSMDALHGSSQTAVSHSVRVLLRRLPMAHWDVKGLTK
jgi:hypothetical protein